MLQLTDLRTSASSISETTGNTTFKVLKGLIKEDDTGKIISCMLTCRVIDGIRHNFKLPATTADAVKNVQAMLDKGTIVRVKFEKLMVVPFAFINDSGKLLTGISTKAESFNIASTEEPDTADLDEIDFAN